MGLGAGRRGTRHKGLAFVPLFPLQPFYFAPRRFKSAGPLSRGAPPGAGLARSQFLLVLRLCVENAHLLARRCQMCGNLFVTTKTVATGIRFNLGPV
jgi:hypothetical protein